MKVKQLVITIGHVLNNSKSNLCLLANDIVVTHRWVCTGTPGKVIGGTRTHGMSAEEERDDLRRFYNIYVKFLEVGALRDTWMKYIQRPFMNRCSYGFLLLQDLFQRTMIRNTPEDVERDVSLPPITERVVKLDFNCLQCLIYNVIVAGTVSNAVLSQREGRDYFLHPSNAPALKTLVDNLYSSCLWFSAIEEKSVKFLLENVQEGLLKRNDKNRQYPTDDVQLLYKCRDVLAHLFSEHTQFYMDFITNNCSVPLLIADFQDGNKQKLILKSHEFFLAVPNMTPEEKEFKRLTGTGSTKISYLLSRLYDLSLKGEKSIVYCKSKTIDSVFMCVNAFIPGSLIFKSPYNPHHIVTFNTSDFYNVLVMDVDAAYGIDLSQATNIFFTGAIANRATFKQAIKRAHRIGQTRPVYVETLIVKDTVEELLYDYVSRTGKSANDV